MPITKSATRIDELKDILQREVKLKIGDISPDSRLQDLGLDSLARVRLVVAVERRYGVDVEEDQAEKITTVADVLDLIQGATAG